MTSKLQFLVKHYLDKPPQGVHLEVLWNQNQSTALIELIKKCGEINQSDLKTITCTLLPTPSVGNAWKQVSIDFTLIGWESGVRVLWANHKLETYSYSSSDGGASSISIGINLPFEGCCGAFFFFLLTLFRITLAKSLMSSFCVDCLKFKQN